MSRTLTVRVPCTDHGILATIDDCAAKLHTTRIRAAGYIFTAALGHDVKLWFEDHKLCVNLNEEYVMACEQSGIQHDQMIVECVKRGVRSVA